MKMSINIEYVELSNFRSYGSEPTRVYFNQKSPVLIVGDNGSGKSSIPTAIIWCLFGRTFNNAKPGDRVINWESKCNCYVKIKTVDDYVIERTRKFDNKNELSLYKNGEDLTLSTNIEAQKQLVKLFNLDYDIFVNSMFFGQMGKSFLKMSDPIRKSTLEKLLCIDKLNIWASVAKEKYSKSDSRQSSIREEINRTESNKEKLSSSLSDYYDMHKKHNDDHDKSLKELENNISELRKKIDYWDKHIKKSIDSNNNKIRRINNLSKRLNKITNYINNLEFKIKSNIEHIEQYNNNILRDQEYINKYDDFDFDELVSKHSEADKNQRKIDELNDKLNQIERHIGSISNKLHPINEMIKSWNDKSEAKCPECLQIIDSMHVRDQCESYIEIKSDLEEKLNKLHSAKNKLINAIDDIDINRPSMSISEIDGIKNTIDNKTTQINSYREKVSKLNDDNHKMQNIVSKSAKLIGKVNDKINLIDITMSLDDIRNEENNRRDMDNNLNSFIRSYDKERDLVNPYDSVIKKTEATINDIDNDLKKLRLDLDDMVNQAVCYNYIYKAYNDRRKIKSYIMKELIPFLNERVSYYMNSFECDFINVEFTPSLGVKSDKWSYDDCSGGEQKRIDVSVLFGLYDLYIAMFGKQCNVMILDEIDGSLDSDGVDCFVNVVMNNFANDDEDRLKPDSVFIVSHNNYMMDKFPNRMNIYVKNGFSKIEVIQT